MTLSDRAYWIFALTALLGIGGQWAGGIFSQLWLMPAALMVAAVFAERAALHAMDWQPIRRVPGQVHLGEPFRGELVLKNSGVRALTIECEAGYPDFFKSADRTRSSAIVRSHVPPGGQTRLPFQLTPLELGVSGLGNLHTRVLGFLGLVWWYRRFDDQVSVHSTPRAVARVARGAGENLSGARYSRKPAAGGLEFHSHRSYQPGDPLQVIDWKASARADDLVVRVMTREQRLELAILLDCGRTSQVINGELSQLHHHVNVAARLAEHAVACGDPVSFVAYADRPLAVMPLTGGLKSLRKIRSMLSNARGLPQESNLLSAALQARRLLGHRALVIILTDMSAGDDAAQFGRAVRLLSSRHNTIIAGIENTEIRLMRWMDPASWMDPYRSYAAMEYCRAHDLARMQLRASGASVLTAAAGELGNVVLDHYRRIRQQLSV